MRPILYKIKSHTIQSALILTILSILLCIGSFLLVSVAPWKGMTRSGLIGSVVGGVGILISIAFWLAVILQKNDKDYNAFGVAALTDGIGLLVVLVFELYDIVSGKELIGSTGLLRAILLVYGIPLLVLGFLLSLLAWMLTKDKDSEYNVEDDGMLGIFGKKSAAKQKVESYDKEHLSPVIRCSICTGEQVAGFRDSRTGKFEEIMLITNDKDLDAFMARYGITEIRKEY